MRRRVRLGALLTLCAACGSTAKPTAGGEGGAGGETAGAGGQNEGEPPEAGAGGTAGSDPIGPGGTGGTDDSAGAAGAAGAEQHAGAGGEGPTQPQCRTALPVTYRDFNPYGSVSGHDDFEVSARGIKNNDGSAYQGWNEIGCGLVAAALGVDRKPQLFAGAPDTQSGVFVPGNVGYRQRSVSGPGCFTSANPSPTGECLVSACQPWSITPLTYSIKSGSSFEQWFRTVEGVNIEVAGELALVEGSPGSGIWSFDSEAFFPLDGVGFGNSPGLAHNYSFTTEAQVKFTYRPGQFVKFRGDDDLWIFVNGKLAIDLGGQHQPLTATIDLDAQAAALGLEPGKTYSLDLFHAERQSTISTFHLSTNIACFEPR